MAPARIAVLISGRGSNLEALLAAERAGRFNGSVVAVISNRADAAGLDKARAHGVPSIEVLDHRQFADRDGFDAALVAAIDAHAPDLVVLAGFMRILGRDLALHYAGRMLNIHPSLLPAYTGLNTHRRALADGVRVHGCTVHFVTPELDYGPIVAQGVVAVHDDDDEASLAARVLAVEHRVLPDAVGAFCAGRVVIAGRHVRVTGAMIPEQPLLVPVTAT